MHEVLRDGLVRERVPALRVQTHALVKPREEAVALVPIFLMHIGRLPQVEVVVAVSLPLREERVAVRGREGAKRCARNFEGFALQKRSHHGIFSWRKGRANAKDGDAEPLPAGVAVEGEVVLGEEVQAVGLRQVHQVLPPPATT